jgi:hypothetical protein
VTKHQKYEPLGIGKIPRCILGARGRTKYTVILPGFTVDEILRYVGDQTSTPFHPSSVFSGARFSIEEIRGTFNLFEKTQLIKPFVTRNTGNIETVPRELNERYFIADERLRRLGQFIWDLYKEKLSILETKYYDGSFDDRDGAWLQNIVGMWKAMDLIQMWEYSREMEDSFLIGPRRFNEEGIEIKDEYRENQIKNAYQKKKIRSSFNKTRETEFDAKVDAKADELMEQFGPVLEEYGLPRSYIQVALSIS